MKLSIATVSLSGDLKEKLAAIAAAGFDGVEIFETDLLTFDGTPSDARRMIADHGLQLTLFQPFRDFEGLPPALRARAFERAERKFDLMHDLGADLMLVCSSVSVASLGGVDRAADDFRELGERAGARGLRVGFEALAWGRHINDHRDAWEVVRRANHPNIGIILDSFHTLARGVDPETIRSIPADKIFLVQLADAPRMDMGVLYWSRHYRSMPGQGDLPLAQFTQAVLATGYTGALSLEIFNDQFRAAAPKPIAVDGRRSLINLIDEVVRVAPELVPGVEPLPDRVRVKGVEFVEFAVSAQQAATFELLLSSMGFSPAARHRSKQVTLWQQHNNAGIKIVVNADPDGFARTSYVVHGTNAYAIGLRVEDAQATVARAKALGASLFVQSRAEGDVPIPAIRGIGGGVIYFVDDDLARVWDVEFEPLTPSAAIDANLRAFDHVAQTMNYSEMLTWVLFYTSIFKASKLPSVDVVDPAGVVRSQVIESDGEAALRLTLNGAEGHQTLAGFFMTESFGSSIQHIAFATPDIFKTARTLETLGFRSLEVSPNYYGDLEARLGIDKVMSATLREHHLLYDRDEYGEYFQMYGEASEDGFFFEIVERRDGYRGYGAGNAPFRIAAQKRGLRPSGVPRA